MGSFSEATFPGFSVQSKKLACVEVSDVRVGLELGLRACEDFSSGLWTISKT